MNIQQSQRFFVKTASIAIAVTSLLVTGSTLAAPRATTPPKPTTTTPAASAGTIVDIASSNKSFTTLVKALKAAGLVETLSGSGPFTVFAPTNAAFAALPKATLQKLSKPENKATLQKILTYHVVSGEVDSKSIKPGSVATVEGSPVNIQVKNGRVIVGGAKVIKADIKASNGIIHVIDKVIIPPDVKL